MDERFVAVVGDIATGNVLYRLWPILNRNNVTLHCQPCRQLQCVRFWDLAQSLPGSLHPLRLPPLRHVCHDELGLLLCTTGEYLSHPLGERWAASFWMFCMFERVFRWDCLSLSCRSTFIRWTKSTWSKEGAKPLISFYIYFLYNLKESPSNFGPGLWKGATI